MKTTAISRIDQLAAAFLITLGMPVSAASVQAMVAAIWQENEQTGLIGHAGGVFPAGTTVVIPAFQMSNLSAGARTLTGRVQT